ncbi:hypothetical protein SJS85_08920 [Aeromonas caviae]|nr:hypothetical protein [Aeromonas caviae]MBL0509882.1 hypothetical protein [Aeromonas caviae]MDX7835533.1 hypothetical protein [Aeromonas caviae]
MKLKLILATIGLAASAMAHSAPAGWIQRDDCGFVMAPYVYSDGVATMNLTPAGDLWLALPGKVSSVKDRQSTEMLKDKVLTINGSKLKAGAQYYPDSDLVLIAPYTPEGVQEFRSQLQRGGQVTIKYNHTIINAKFPPLSDGEQSIANCKKPI